LGCHYMIENIRKNRVKQFREAIPLSVSELALKSRLTRQTIAKMEKGCESACISFLIRCNFIFSHKFNFSFRI